MIDIAADIFKYFLLVWLGLLAGFVIRDVLFNRRAMRGILCTGRSRVPDPERITLLFLTIGFALYYSLTTLAIPIDELPLINDRQAMPDIPMEILVVLLGTQATFVLGKFLRLYAGVRKYV